MSLLLVISAASLIANAIVAYRAVVLSGKLKAVEAELKAVVDKLDPVAIHDDVLHLIARIRASF